MVHSRATFNTQPRSSAWSFLGLGEPSGASGITEVAETGDYNLSHANPLQRIQHPATVFPPFVRESTEDKKLQTQR
jgi:hypothetical protein